MIIVLFRSRLRPEAGEDYHVMADEMESLARTMPGFVDVKFFTAADGERLTVVWWQDEETMRGWRENVRHRIAQRAGREKWYEYYRIEVATVVRSAAFAQPTEKERGTGAEAPT
jgi:heme-degrading monooxygenase HmoA